MHTYTGLPSGPCPDDRAKSADACADTELEPYLRYTAHELRNAFGAVLGWSSVLRRSSGMPPLVAQGMDAIERNVRLQSALLEDLLDGARLCQGELPLEITRLRIGELLNQVLGDSAALVARAEVRLRPGPLDESVTVLADEARLRRMLAALLRAALESSERGGALAISALPAGTCVELRIADAAIDAGERHVERIEAGLSDEGVPRSLVLVARLAQLQNGRLDVHGLGGDGARCDLRLRLPRL